MGQHKLKQRAVVRYTDDVINEGTMNAEQLKAAVDKFDVAFHQRSFSQRNPELGKMIKCASCGHRHRSYECPQRFATTIRQEGKQVPCEPRVSPLPRVLRAPVNLYWRPKPNKQVDLMMYQLRKKAREQGIVIN